MFCSSCSNPEWTCRKNTAMITEIPDQRTRLLILHPESAAERDDLLRTLHYPVPLNPEDMRDIGILTLADYEFKAESGHAGFGVAVLQFERNTDRQRGPIDPDRHLRPLKVASGDLLSADDVAGTWNFTPSPGSSVQPLVIKLQNVAAGSLDTEAFGVIIGKWQFQSPGSLELDLTGSADGRTGVFSFVLSRNHVRIRVVGSFIARGKAVATYFAQVNGESMTGQIEGTRLD